MSAAGDEPGRQDTSHVGCKTIQSEQIVVECSYSNSRTLRPYDRHQPAVALNWFKMVFDAGDEGPMFVELTLTNSGKKAITEPRTVAITIDDPSGRNYLHRTLSNVDLRTLQAKKSQKFTERFLTGAFRPGHYLIHLWIVTAGWTPASHEGNNLLIANGGIADSHTGMNTLADFQIGTR